MKAREDLAPKSDSVETRDVSLSELNAKFDISSGHNHDGINSARIDYNDLLNIPDYSFMIHSLTMPENEFNVSSSIEGILNVTWKNQETGTFLAAPSHSSGQPSFREIVLSDIPDLSSLYSVVSHTHVLNDLSNVNAIPSPGDALIWNDTVGEWQAGEPGTIINSLNDISDVSITEITSNEILVWNGTSWINNTLEEAGIAAAIHDHDTVYLKLTGGTLIGALTASIYQIIDSNSKIVRGSNNAVRVQTPSGYIDIGSQNAARAHFYTDRPIFHFGSPMTVATRLEIYNTNTYLTGIEGKIDGNFIWHAGNDGSGSGLDADLLDGQHASTFATATHNHDSVYVKGPTSSTDGGVAVFDGTSGKVLKGSEYTVEMLLGGIPI